MNIRPKLSNINIYEKKNIIKNNNIIGITIIIISILFLYIRYLIYN